MVTIEIFRGRLIVLYPVKAHLKYVVVLQNNLRIQVKDFETAAPY
jgi:hypothetical protein